MKTKNNTKKAILLLALCSISAAVAFFGPSDNTGSGAMNGMATGALIGGLAGGGRGAGYGALAGLAIGSASGAANERRYRNDQGYYNNRNYGRNNGGGYDPRSRTSMRNYINQLEEDNQQLRNENYNLMRQIHAPSGNAPMPQGGNNTFVPRR